MPPLSLAQASNADYQDYRETYSTHYDLLLSFCGEASPLSGGGEVDDVPWDDDVTVVSPPKVIAPYTCSRGVEVQSVNVEGLVELWLDGAPVGTAPAEGNTTVSFELGADLLAGQELKARQSVDGVFSDYSEAVFVTDYPFDELPPPVIDPETVYQCGTNIAVRTVPGATLTAWQNNAFPETVRTSSAYKIMGPGPKPFAVGVQFTAQASLCGRTSPISDPVATIPAPQGLPEPRHDPAQPYEGQEYTVVRDLTYGAFAQMEVSGAFAGNTCAAATGVSCVFSVLDSPVGRVLAMGDRLEATPSLSCAWGPTGPTARTPPALPCDQLPAPRIATPTEGDDVISVIEALPSARIRVYDENGTELADGSGTAILLDPPRTIAAGETIVAIQQIGECKGTTGWEVTAGSL